MHNVFPFITVDENSICDVCHYARDKRLPYSVSSREAFKCYELLHFDIGGPIFAPSFHGHRFSLIALDDFSIFTWVSLLKSKAKVSDHVKNFVFILEIQNETKDNQD